MKITMFNQKIQKYASLIPVCKLFFFCDCCVGYVQDIQMDVADPMDLMGHMYPGYPRRPGTSSRAADT